MEDLSKFCCRNEACSEYGKRDAGTIRVRARYGPGKQRRLLYCLVCKQRFSETRGTPLFDCRLPHEQALCVLAHIQDGCGVRQTERLTGAHRDTVTRLSRRAGEHAYDAHDFLVSFSPRDPEDPAR